MKQNYDFRQSSIVCFIPVLILVAVVLKLVVTTIVVIPLG